MAPKKTATEKTKDTTGAAAKRTGGRNKRRTETFALYIYKVL